MMQFVSNEAINFTISLGFGNSSICFQVLSTLFSVMIKKESVLMNYINNI